MLQLSTLCFPRLTVLPVFSSALVLSSAIFCSLLSFLLTALTLGSMFPLNLQHLPCAHWTLLNFLLQPCFYFHPCSSFSTLVLSVFTFRLVAPVLNFLVVFYFYTRSSALVLTSALLCAIFCLYTRQTLIVLTAPAMFLLLCLCFSFDTLLLSVSP
jgi:hypothetical protein